MEKLRRYHVGDFVLTFVLVIMLVYGCSQKSVNNETFPTVSLSMKVTEPGLMQYVDQFRLIVTAPDMDSINTSLSLEKGYLVGAVEVPAGKARTFTILALDAASGDTIYRGDTLCDVTAGATIVLTINLYPQVPLIKLSPCYQEVNANSIFSADVKVFKITDLYSITFRIHFGNYVIRPDSAVSTLYVLDSLYYDSSFYELVISQADQLTPIVNDSGNATLGTVFFQSFEPESGTERAELSIQVTGMTKVVDSTVVGVPFGDIYPDRGIIEVRPRLLTDSIVTFRDPRLEYVVRNQLEKYSGPIYRSEVNTITTLNADTLGILNLPSLSELKALQFLELDFNQITDIRELSSLTNLSQLFLNSNTTLENIAPLAGMPNLSQLDLRWTQVGDVSPLYAFYLSGNNTLGLPDLNDMLLLSSKYLTNTAQLDALCLLGVIVFLDDTLYCTPQVSGF
jgi:hypothetical protein